MKILLIVSGSVAAYKSLDLVRRLRERGHAVTSILTGGGAQFITPLSLASLSGNPCYTELFSLKDETEMGHIRLVREADVVLIAPASANLLAKMAHGLADDLASTCLLANDRPVLACPAMNVRMWQHPATRRNLATLEADGVRFVQPRKGALACGEEGDGRLAEPDDIVAALDALFIQEKPLQGLHALVTAGPTHEPLDPVRFLGNRSSGKQGFAIAEALAAQGARVTLVAGPTDEATPPNVDILRVQTAHDMLRACEQALPADIAVCAAAVADWRLAEPAAQKRKKEADTLTLTFEQTPDILATLSRHARRPRLVVGFAAETEHLIAHAQDKRRRKGCDWLVANDVGGGAVFAAADNTVHLVTESGVEDWPTLSKRAVAERLAARIAAFFHPVSAREPS